MKRAIDRSEGDRFAARILRRELVSIPREELRQVVAGQVILVTGAGGYIGTALYEIDRELRSDPSAPRFTTVICDIRDPIALNRLFASQRPETVFHAAALKHLPLTEANAREAVLTNAIGTDNLIDACQWAQTAALIHISTDKAAAPTSILGKTKRVAELICQAADDRAGTRCTSVRFNNVFGSSGSVVPLFLEQVAKGEDLTITDPRMNRHFVTASEATQLIIAALGMSQAANAADRAVYFLEAGSSMAIAELARRILAEAGASPKSDLVIIGMRAGEKLDEQLTAPWEVRRATTSPLIGLADNSYADELAIPQLVSDLREACDQFNEARLRTLLDAATAEPSDTVLQVAGREVA
jgi:FlaA1/EpsC-like NDP-sugar epimerase